MTIEEGSVRFAGFYLHDEEDGWRCVILDEDWPQDEMDGRPPRGYSEGLLDQIDGCVVYAVDYVADEGDEFKITKQQPFREGDHETGSERKMNIWGWDGDEESPSLSPSYGWGEWLVEEGWAIHLYFRNGEIDPCSDMVLEVEEP